MNNKGFTIYEVLSVIVIITILGGVIIPVISNYIEDGKNKYNNMLKNLRHEFKRFKALSFKKSFVC